MKDTSKINDMLNMGKNFLSGNMDRVATKGQIALKKAYQYATNEKGCQKKLVFIVGCQRSGTTLMVNVFEKDINTKIYREFSILSSQDKDKNLRLNPLPSVMGVIEKDRAPIVIMKPLVETQNIKSIMSFFGDSKAIFVYRSYKDVAFSDMNHFGEQNGISNLRPIVEKDPGNWRSEKVSENVAGVVRESFSETMPPEDAAALFWYVRNSLYFDLGLDENEDVYLCKYEDLVTKPERVFKRIYESIGARFPGNGLLKDVHSISIGKGDDIKISDGIKNLCEDLSVRLDSVYLGRQNKEVNPSNGEST